MATTYTTLTADPSKGQILVRAELWGIPFLRTGIDAGGADCASGTAYGVNPVALVSRIPTAGGYTTAQMRGFVATLQEVSRQAESVNLQTGAVTLGSLTLRFTDTPDGYFADLFAVDAASKIASLAGSGITTYGEGTITIDTDATLTAGRAYFLGAETVVCTVTDASQPDILRGTDAARATTRLHSVSTQAQGHASQFYDRPRWFAQRPVALFFGYDHASIGLTEELGPFLFVTRRAPTYSAAGVWELQCESYLAVTQKTVADRAFKGVVSRALGTPQMVIFSLPIGSAQNVVTPSSADGVRRTSYTDTTWLRVGDEAVEVTINDASDNQTLFTVKRRAGLATERGDESPGADAREFVPCEIRTGADGRTTTARVGYKVSPYAALTANNHGVTLFLCQLISRDGDSTNIVGSDDSYDVLPAPFGLAIPAARVNVASFRAVREATPLLTMPHAKLGWDGPRPALDWWHKEFAPFAGAALYTGPDGISCARTGDVFPFESSVSIDHTSIEASQNVGWDQGHEDWTGRVSFTVRDDDGHRVRVEARSVQARELFPDSYREVKYESAGFGVEAIPALEDRLASLIAAGEKARPIVRFRLPWRFHVSVYPGVVLSMTHTGVPDGRNADYGVAAESYRVLSANIVPPTREGSGAWVDVVAARATRNRACHVGPSATVSSWNAGTLTLTVAANDYTPTATDIAFMRTSDAVAFSSTGATGSQGTLGCYVRLYSSSLVKLTDNAVRISSIGSGTITVNAAFTLAAAPVTPVAGNILRLAPMTATIASAIAGGTCSAEQDDFGFAGDPSDGLIDTGVSNYEYVAF